MSQSTADSNIKVVPECVSCGHAEPHDRAGIGVCAAAGCGCDGPVDRHSAVTVVSHAPRPDGPRLLVNALREEREVFVAAEGALRRLPRVPAPNAIEVPVLSDRPLSLVVPRRDRTAGLRMTSLHWVDDMRVDVVADLPEVLDGVLYLVDPDVLTAFPWREDFVTPALWAHSVPMGRKKSKKSKAKSKRRGKAGWHLAGVTRSVYPAADPSTPDLEDLVAMTEEEQG